MYRYITAVCAAFALSAAAQAQTAQITEHEALALEMMELSGAADMANVMMEQIAPLMEPSFRQGYPDATDAQIAEALSIFSEAFRARNDQMNLEVARVYADLLSLEDLRATIAFYRTSAGQNILATIPEAMARSTAVGERLAQDILAAEGARMEAVLTGDGSQD